VAHLLGDGEAKRILAWLTDEPQEPERKQLASVAEIPGQKPSVEEVRAVLQRVIEEKPKPSLAPSQEELAEKWRQQKVRARQWAIDRGLDSELAEVQV
jgi:hypothetical protein